MYVWLAKPKLLIGEQFLSRLNPGNVEHMIELLQAIIHELDHKHQFTGLKGLLYCLGDGITIPWHKVAKPSAESPTESSAYAKGGWAADELKKQYLNEALK